MPKLDLKNAPGHQVLAAAGKKALRPGGFGATDQLLTFANFQPRETVLELAASFGDTAIRLAKQYGVRVTGIEKNPDSVARAQVNVATAGLTQQVQIIQGDIFHLEQISEQFDYVLAEAILTMQTDAGKAKILRGIYDRLKPGGRFLSHELRVEGANADTIRRELSATIRVNAAPLSQDGWIRLVEEAGFVVESYDIGSMTLLNPSRIAQEEGVQTLLTIAWNMFTRPTIRQRILSMRETFVCYHSDLGYIVLTARKGN
ncbi:class I SAM-dependent methyltransferase [Gloeomargaritales cyanobacterium VI4D9]|nr:class I SAM-dependent methyltransferase [Gloeomargaritales cyanobacterium VI4D9]